MYNKFSLECYRTNDLDYHHDMTADNKWYADTYDWEKFSYACCLTGEISTNSVSAVDRLWEYIKDSKITALDKKYFGISDISDIYKLDYDIVVGMFEKGGPLDYYPQGIEAVKARNKDKYTYIIEMVKES